MAGYAAGRAAVDLGLARAVLHVRRLDLDDPVVRSLVAHRDRAGCDCAQLRAAAPIAKDVLTFLYDREQAMASLEALEAGWGGNIEQRMASKYAAFQGQPADPPPLDPTA